MPLRMAPTRGGATGKSPKIKSTGVQGKKVSNLHSTSRVSKSKLKRPPPKEVKSKSRSAPDQLKKTKKRVYTEKELDLPSLNMITPVGVQRPKGRKKGKVFVDDQVSFRRLSIELWLAGITVLMMVNTYRRV